ncbi:MAG: Fe-S cluster assembly protein NifU [Nitrospirae bacterium]|nr:Fe-S cluster assembly protein NifU [Nitrospirota bacterium]
MIKGRTLDEALKVTNKEIAGYLGGLPREKMHCSVMGREALEAAIDNYRGFKRADEKGGEIVCKCFGVTDRKIKRVAAENNLRTVEDITNFTKAGGGCGDCASKIEDILKEVWADKVIKEVSKPKERLTNIRKIGMIQDIINKEIRPLLQADGGDVELIDVDGIRVIISLRGMCTGCLMADVTLKNIENKLRELVSEELVVEAE